MKLKDARDNYYFNSGKTSDLVRQLGLAAIAVIWLFKYEVSGTPKIPGMLQLPLILTIAGLALDLLQYASATAIWGIFHRLKERSLAEDPPVVDPLEKLGGLGAPTGDIGQILAEILLLLYMK